MNQPFGWCSPDERLALKTLARDKRVIEIGSWKGLSASVMAPVAKHLVCLDWFQGDDFTKAALNRDDNPPRRNVISAFLEAVECMPVTVMVGDMFQVLPMLDARDFDFIFYDADHTGEATDFALKWAGTSQATVAVHDYKPHIEKYQAACRAVDDFAVQLNLSLRLVGSLAIFERTQP